MGFVELQTKDSIEKHCKISCWGNSILKLKFHHASLDKGESVWNMPSHMTQGKEVSWGNLLQVQKPGQLGMQTLRKDDFPLLSWFKTINGRDIKWSGIELCFRNFFPLLSFKDFKNIFPFRWQSLRFLFYLRQYLIFSFTQYMK